MYRTGLMPPRLALLGVVGGPLIFLSSIAVLFGVYEQDGLHALFSLPEGLFEPAFAIYLIVWGFRPSPVLATLRDLGYGRGIHLKLMLALVALVALAIPVAAEAGEQRTGAPQVTVMTRNLFLGADLGPAIQAASIPEAIDGGGVIWNELLSTNFPERAVPLAKEIDRSAADLVGLQEVALWRQQIPSDLAAPPTGPGQPATEVKFDFLALLLAELDKLGGDYEVVHVQQEFDAELPVDLDANDATGGPLGAELDGRLTMRDVILRRKNSKVSVSQPTGANYTTMYTPLIGGAIPLPVKRGWQSVEATLQKRAVPLRQHAPRGLR